MCHLSLCAGGGRCVLRNRTYQTGNHKTGQNTAGALGSHTHTHRSRARNAKIPASATYALSRRPPSTPTSARGTGRRSARRGPARPLLPSRYPSPSQPSSKATCRDPLLPSPLLHDGQARARRGQGRAWPVTRCWRYRNRYRYRYRYRYRSDLGEAVGTASAASRASETSAACT